MASNTNSTYTFETFTADRQKKLLEHKQKLEAGDPEALKKELASQKEIAEYYKTQLIQMENEKNELRNRLRIIYDDVMSENKINIHLQKKIKEREQIEEIQNEIARLNPHLPEAIWDQWVRFAEYEKKPIVFWQKILDNGKKNKGAVEEHPPLSST